VSAGGNPRTGMRRARRRLGWLLALVAPLVAATPRDAPPPGSLPPVKVQDLYYGDVLFYFFQDDYFDALTRLTAAQARNRLQHHADDAELLLGGLYLSVGQHREAGEIFARVLDGKNVPAPVRDRARFFLGKVWYLRGYLDKAIETLGTAGRGTDATGQLRGGAVYRYGSTSGRPASCRPLPGRGAESVG